MRILFRGVAILVTAFVVASTMAQPAAAQTRNAPEFCDRCTEWVEPGVGGVHAFGGAVWCTPATRSSVITTPGRAIASGSTQTVAGERLTRSRRPCLLRSRVIPSSSERWWRDTASMCGTTLRSEQLTWHRAKGLSSPALRSERRSSSLKNSGSSDFSSPCSPARRCSCRLAIA